MQFPVVCLAGLCAALIVAGCSKFTPIDPISRLEAPPRLPEPETTYLDMGRQFLKINDPVQAKVAFIRSIREEGATAAALSGAGLAAERMGLLTEARRFFERARLKAPSSVLAHNNLGAVLYRMGAYHEAKQAFQAAFALSSGNSRTASHNLALAGLAIRRKQEETLTLVPNPLPIQRQGTGEYRLIVPGVADAKTGKDAGDKAKTKDAKAAMAARDAKADTESQAAMAAKTSENSTTTRTRTETTKAGQDDKPEKTPKAAKTAKPTEG